MTDTAALDLASLLCSRLCHDMLSPVGALSNGLELLRDEKDPEMRRRCMELLEQSAKASADKLKFFRLAFGAAGGFGQMVSVAEARELIAALIGDSGRITLDWKVSREELPKAAVKTLLNLAAMGIEALVRGGTLEVGAEMTGPEAGPEAGGASEIVIRAVGPRIAFDQTIGQALDGSMPEGELSSRTAPAAMIHRLAASTGGGVQWHHGEDALVMGAVLPHTAPHG